MKEIVGLPKGFRYCAAPGVCLEDTYHGDRGTIGVIAVDRLTGRNVALTAMHVFDPITEYPAASAPVTLRVKSPCSGPAADIAGTLLRGSRAGIDAAVIDVHDATVTNSIGAIGATIEFWRPANAADVGKRVRMVGAFSKGVRIGTVLKADVAVPDLGLEAALLVEMSAVPGDSGAPLLDANDNLLGLLVGGNDTRQFFCAIGPILSRLQCKLF